MRNTVEKPIGTSGVPRQQRGLLGNRSLLAGKLLISATAIAAAISACTDEGHVTGPTLTQSSDGTNDGSGLRGGDSESSVDSGADATATTDNDGANIDVNISDDVTTVTSDTVDTVDTTDTVDAVASDATDAVVGATDAMTFAEVGATDTMTFAEIAAADAVDTDSSEVAAVAETTNETTVVASDTLTADADASTDVKPDGSKPSTPKEACEQEKAKIIAALKPGEPQCKQTVPGVGDLSGDLNCDGGNLNCVVK